MQVSIPYMAPEQHTNFHGVTRHADIYSFGAILHDIFNGGTRVPYQQLSADGNIGLIIQKCTEEDIHRRFDNVDVLRNVLLAYLSKEEIETSKDADILQWINDIENVSNWNSDVFDSFFDIY